MPGTNSLAKSLRLLADELKRLAELVEAQKESELLHGSKRLSVIGHAMPKSADSRAEEIKAKYEKDFLYNWLLDKDITPIAYESSLKGKKYLVQAAEFLADHYDRLKDFYKKLKMNTGQSRRNFHHISNNGRHLNFIKKWCAMLEEIEIIDDFKLESEQKVFVDISLLNEAIGFVNGYWLEIYLRSEIANALSMHLQKIHSFDIMAGVQITKADDSKSELDLLLMVNSYVLWFECKTGKINEYYERFNEHRKLMQLNSRDSFLLIPEENAQLSINVRKRSGMHLLSATTLEWDLERLFKRILN